MIKFQMSKWQPNKIRWLLKYPIVMTTQCILYIWYTRSMNWSIQVTTWCFCVFDMKGPWIEVYPSVQQSQKVLSQIQWQMTLPIRINVAPHMRPPTRLRSFKIVRYACLVSYMNKITFKYQNDIPTKGRWIEMYPSVQ